MKATFRDLQREFWFRARNSGELVWETKNGDLIPIKNMSDTHLLNCINMIQKQLSKREAYEYYVNECYEALSSIGDITF